MDVLGLDEFFAGGQGPQNIYVCYSNLHAIQACLLSADAPGICLYTDAVSEEYLRQAFNGVIKSVNGRIGTLKDVLFFVFKIKKYQHCVNIFVGTKVGYAALAILNQFPRHTLYLLDDGLAMYGLSQQRPQPSSPLKLMIKRTMAMLLLSLQGTYFSGDTVGSLDRKGIRLLLWPQLFAENDAGVNCALIERLGHAGQAKLAELRNIALSADRSIYVASYEKSVEIVAGATLDCQYDEVLLHPRVSPSSNPIPLEVYLPQYRQITMGMSSIILVLAYLNYRGHLVFDADQYASWVMEKISHTIDLPFSYRLLGSPS